MMSAADLSTTNPPGGSSTCTNSCDCHSSFSSDPPATLFPAAPRPAPPVLLGNVPIRPCFHTCVLRFADYVATQGPYCRLDVMPIIQALWDAGQRSFTATNILMGGDPCPSRTKQLKISVMFWETYDYVEYYYLQIPENTTNDLSPVCCVPR